MPNYYQVFLFFISATYNADVEDPYPSLSDFHDYEPNLEFDDSDLLQQKHPENDDGMIFFSNYFPLFLIIHCDAYVNGTQVLFLGGNHSNHKN